ncbi:MAG: hypothetical protein QOK67_11140 [Nitrososphaeraceae archaeon]|nr:hypothetical protein [Nitrososphaeraceae archaeon]
MQVANAVPGDKDYSPLWQTNFVKWNNNTTVRELKSVEEILAAQKRSNPQYRYRKNDCNNGSSQRLETRW